MTFTDEELAGRFAAAWASGGTRDNPHPGEADQWRAVVRQTRRDMVWRCFHCDQVFATKEEARLHFGSSEMAEASCTVDAKRLREVEALLARYQAEDSDLDRKYHAMVADHAVALRRAEEEGYAKGLRDGMATP